MVRFSNPCSIFHKSISNAPEAEAEAEAEADEDDDDVVEKDGVTAPEGIEEIEQ